jgi:O-antigen ligase
MGGFILTKGLCLRKNISFIIFSALIVFSAFIGIYYPEEFFIVHIISALFLLFCLFINGEKEFLLFSLMDYLLLALTLLYIISTIWAADIQLAFEESLKYINYYLVYLFAAKIIPGRQTHTIIKVFILVGGILAFIGILNYLEILSLEGVIQGGRITVTLKYPNALGSFLLACIVLAHYGIGEWKPNWIYKLCIYIMIVAFIGTFSRANYLVAVPIIIGLYLILLKGQKQVIRASLLLLLGGISASLVIYSGAAVYLKLAVFVIGLTATVISGKKKTVLFCALILTAVVFFLIPQGTGRDNPVDTSAASGSRVVDRIQEINLEDSSLQVRLVIYQDALKLIKETPLWGKGGGAWRTLYPSVRSFLYYSSDPHSYPLKIAAETGLIGLALFFAVLLCIFKNIIQVVQERNRVVALALCAILLHSFVDFDVTIGFLALTVWILLGITQNSPAVKSYKAVSIRKWLLIAFCGAFLTVSSALLAANNLADITEEVTYEEASSRLLQAVSLYPLNSVNYGTLANADHKAFQLTGDQKYLDLAIKHMEKAIKLSPLNYNWYLDKAYYLTGKEEWDQVAAVIINNQGLLSKFHNDSYTKAAYYLRMCAIGYLDNNEIEKGQQVLADTIGLWERAQAEIAAVPSEYYTLWREEEIITEYDPFLLEVINAYDYLGEKEKARKLIPRLAPKIIAENKWLGDI